METHSSTLPQKHSYHSAHSDMLQRSKCQTVNTGLERWISSNSTAECDESLWACSGMCLCICSSEWQAVGSLFCTELFWFPLKSKETCSHVDKFMYICASWRGINRTIVHIKQRKHDQSHVQNWKQRQRNRKLTAYSSGRNPSIRFSGFSNQYPVMTFWWHSAYVCSRQETKTQDSATTHLPLLLLIYGGSLFVTKTVAGHRCHEN